MFLVYAEIIKIAINREKQYFAIGFNLPEGSVSFIILGEDRGPTPAVLKAPTATSYRVPGFNM